LLLAFQNDGCKESAPERGERVDDLSAARSKKKGADLPAVVFYQSIKMHDLGNTCELASYPVTRAVAVL
jgi:hypothetical protein